MNSKERDQYYGVQPKNRELTREDLPRHPAKKPSPDYCKKGKGEHIYVLDEVTIYPAHSRVGSALLITEYSRWKEYRCEACGKKRLEWKSVQLDTPTQELARV